MQSQAQQLLGFGSYGVFRASPAYQYSVEHSIYVEQGHRGRGIGRLLLTELIERALVMRIEIVESFARIGGGRGGYWEDRGHERYAGI